MMYAWSLDAVVVGDKYQWTRFFHNAVNFYNKNKPLRLNVQVQWRG